MCDGGDRYAHTYYDDDWLAVSGIDIAPYEAALEAFLATGRLGRDAGSGRGRDGARSRGWPSS